MKKPAIPDNEVQRLNALCGLNILDTPSEARFDRITRIAKKHFDVSIALVSLVDSERQWFKSRQGLDATETPRDISFCGHAILDDQVFYVPDALQDSRFHDNPLVTGGPKIRFYAGAPLHSPAGFKVGTLCIIDDKPRQFNQEELNVLGDLADMVDAELSRSEVLQTSIEFQQQKERLDHLIQMSPGVTYSGKASGDFGVTYVSENVKQILGYDSQQFTDNSGFWLEHIHPEDKKHIQENLQQLCVKGDCSRKYRFLHQNGSYRWMQDRLHLVRDTAGNPQEIVGLWMDITETKVLEANFLANENRIRAIVETVVDGIIVINAEGIIQTHNPAAEALFGYHSSEVIGKNVKMLMPEPYQSAHDSYIHNYLNTGEEKVIGIGREVVGKRKNGSSFDMELAVSEMNINGEKMFTGIVRDISDRKAATEELYRFKHTLDNTLDMIFMFDEESLIFNYMNAGAVESMGYTQAELLNLHPYDIKPDFSEAQFRQYIGPLLDGTKQVLHFESKHRKKSGEDFPVEIYLQLVRSERDSGQFVAIVRDITERNRITEILKRYEAIIQSSDDAVISKTLNGIITSWNPGAEKMFGYSAKEMIGQPMTKIFPQDHLHEEQQILQHIRQGKKVDHFESIRLRKDGTPIDVSVNISPIIDERGKIIGASKIARDITERKKVEQMKSEFISTVSHELRTPLTSIRGALGLVLGKAADRLSEKPKHMLEMAQRNCERLTLLINDILDLEKIESGNLEFDFQQINLITLSQRALDDNEGYARNAQVRLTLNTDIDKAIVRADSHRLLQVFANLLSNAVKYSPHNGEVQVSVIQHKDNYRVLVRDFGEGIPEEFRSRMFQRFSQADSSSTREKGGTGLGLSISKAIIEHHGGRLAYTSEIGEGTEFYFDLPVYHEVVLDHLQNQQTQRVLICEDDPDVADILSEMVKQSGVNCDIAHTASAARKQLETEHYHLLLLDLTLPDIDGLQFLQELRSESQTSSLPIIVVSGRANEGRETFNGQAVMVVDWLQKPVEKDRLERSLLEALKSETRARILHVEDDPDIVQVVQVVLEDIAEVVYTSKISEARYMLAKDNFDLVILDLGLEDGSGLDLLDELKSCCPVVIFSAQKPDHHITEQVAAALTKSITSNEQLLSTIHNMLNNRDN